MAFVTSRDATPQTIGSTNWHLILTVHRDQASANTEGSKADRTAYTGNITNLSVTPQDWWLDRTTGNVRLYKPEPAPTALKVLARTVVSARYDLERQVEGIFPNAPTSVRNNFSDITRRGNQHIYLTLTDSTVSGTRKTNYLNAVLAGPSGLNLGANPSRANVERYLRMVGALTVPTYPAIWCNPLNGTRLALSSLHTRSEHDPTGVLLVGVDWVETIPI